jgi:hypothetical protein
MMMAGPLQGNIAADVNLETLGVEPDGSAWLRTTIGPASAFFHGNGRTALFTLKEGQIALRLDGKDVPTPGPALPPSLEVKISKSGAVLDLRGKGVEELTSRFQATGKFDLNEFLRTFLFALPDEPLKLGEEWKRKGEIKLPGSEAAIPVEYSFVLLGLEKGPGTRARIGFEMRGAAPQIDMGALMPRVPPRASAPAITLKLSISHAMKGEMIFDVEMGQALSSTFQIKDEFSMSGTAPAQEGQGAGTAFKGTLALDIKGTSKLVEQP